MFNPSLSAGGKFLFLAALCLTLPACSVYSLFGESYDEVPPLIVQEEDVKIEDHSFPLNGEDSVVGQLATVPVEEGDTLLDIARHFGLGYQQIVEANPGIDPWVPAPGARVILPLAFVLPDSPHQGVAVNLAALRLFYFGKGKQHPSVSTWPIGVGKEGRSTPTGSMSVDRKLERPTWYVPETIRKDHEKQGDPLPAVVPPGPDNPLGDYALYLSRPSYLIHGTNKPYSIGFRASNGCIRLYPEDIQRAFRKIPVKTPVKVVNQPYLLGWREGELYLEAHAPFEEMNAKQEKKNLVAKLRQIGQKQKRSLDWPKVEKILEQARGIPIPVFAHTATPDEVLADAVNLDHPPRLYGQPEAIEPAGNGWYVRTADSDDGYRVRRLAAMLNHVGPRIPARETVKNGRYRVIAGPFPDAKAAQSAGRLLATDFDVKSEILKPAKRNGRK
ncbi:MAG: L,D-transpeptidase family protein [Methylococcaceae bacterium]|nr:L,D-transpeptidase family protein [Methylococcaceae bacterium]